MLLCLVLVSWEPGVSPSCVDDGEGGKAVCAPLPAGDRAEPG